MYNLVQLIINLIDYYKINKILIGHWIRSFHYNILIYILIFMILLPKKYSFYIILFYIIFIVLPFLFFRGCWVSQLENKLIHDNTNICDLWLEIMNLKINNSNRYYFTIFLGLFYIILLCIIYRFKFI